jgi:osmoprotectant transport system substrate-binding protein
MARRRGLIAAGILVAGALALSACSSSNPTGGSTSEAGTITVGSANFSENDIIAQIYGQALAANGFKVAYKPQIGARPAYLKALTDGSIDLVPEYSGNLLQYYDAKATAASSDEVYTALGKALPKGYEVLKQSPAEDKDSYNVTKAFSDKYGVTSLDDLKKVTEPLSVGANPEFQTRPYGIPGLKSVYGVDATLVPINDGGGPNTVKALVDNQVQLADIYSTTPSIKANNFVTLSDPKNMILAQNVVPLINSKKANSKATSVLNKVSAALTTADLIDLNAETSGANKKTDAQIAKGWLAKESLF